jgi:hypothetical protein
MVGTYSARETKEKRCKRSEDVREHGQAQQAKPFERCTRSTCTRGSKQGKHKLTKVTNMADVTGVAEQGLCKNKVTIANKIDAQGVHTSTVEWARGGGGGGGGDKKNFLLK